MLEINIFYHEFISIVSQILERIFPIALIIMPFYLLPTILAIVSHQKKTKIFIIALTNLLLGWTLIFWLLCLRSVLINSENELHTKIRVSSSNDATLAKIKSLSPLELERCRNQITGAHSYSLFLIIFLYYKFSESYFIDSSFSMFRFDKFIGQEAVTYSVVIIFFILTTIGVALRTRWGRLLGIISCPIIFYFIPIIGWIVGTSMLYYFIVNRSQFSQNTFKYSDIKREWKSRSVN